MENPDERDRRGATGLLVFQPSADQAVYAKPRYTLTSPFATTLDTPPFPPIAFA